MVKKGSQKKNVKKKRVKKIFKEKNLITIPPRKITKKRSLSKKDLLALELRKHKFRVTIFGSARIKNGSRDFRQVYALGKLIGEKGYDIVTGGGPGLMEAASVGHKAGSKKHKNGSKVIGLNIKLPHEQKLNPAIDVSREFSRFSNRLDHFMLFSNVIVVAPGGVGTLLELFFSWQLMQVHHICRLPIILLGEEWQELIIWLKKYPLKKGYFTKDDLNLLFHAKDIHEAMEIIEHAHVAFEAGNADLCLNVKRYKL